MKKFNNKHKKTKKKNILGLFETKILNYLKRDRLTKFSSRELIRKTGIKDKEQFYIAIKNLEMMGHIIVVKHKISLNLDITEKEGEVFSLSKGFGFVRPEDGGEDIFIAGRDLNEALVGDKVLVGKIEKDSKGYSGKIVRILTKASNYTTGTLLKSTWGYEFVPDNKIRYNPKVIDIGNAKVGDKVMAKLVQDLRGDWTSAIITETFGSGECAKVCSDAIIAQHMIPTEFNEKCMLEARAISETGVLESDFKNRIDFRNENVFTIDGADAKDLDDAISLKKFDDYYELCVHIADVSHYIKKGTALDNEAMERGTSVYFANRVIPMLPKEISNGVCSLTSGTDKLCFSAIIKIDFDGNIKKYDFKKTIINSKVRGVYDEINEIFNGTASEILKEKYSPIQKDLELARELANILKEKATLRGRMEIESREAKFVLDENGVCIDVKPRQSGESQELIEQFMICANVCSAKFSIDKCLPFLYRIHENPQATRIKELRELLNALGISAKELAKDKPSSGDFSQIIQRVKETKNHTVVSEKILRTMEKAKYSTEALGHFGLNLKDYSHFTSPIRRYPDTSIHRVLSAFVKGTSAVDIEKKYRKFCEKSATNSTANEIRATVAERETEDCYMAEFMKAHLGETFDGKVSGVSKNGVFVRLESCIEGFLPVETFKDKNFSFDGMISQVCSKTGEVLTIGSELKIVVAKAEVSSGRIDFVPYNQ